MGNELSTVLFFKTVGFFYCCHQPMLHPIRSWTERNGGLWKHWDLSVCLHNVVWLSLGTTNRMESMEYKRNSFRSVRCENCKGNMFSTTYVFHEWFTPLLRKLGSALLF